MDGVLAATGLRWQEVDEQVRAGQYDANDLNAPSRKAVEGFFRLKYAPGLDPSGDSELSYLAALCLEFPQVRQLALCPLLDLMFGLDISKREQAATKLRFSDRLVKQAFEARRSDDYDFMRLLNTVSTNRSRGRPASGAHQPLLDLYRTMLIADPPVARLLFAESELGWSRVLRPIEVEVSEIAQLDNLDALALLYGLVLESLLLLDHRRFGIAKASALAWLPKLEALPECRRVAPLIDLAVRRCCTLAVPGVLSRATAIDRVIPASWRQPGPLIDVAELVWRAPNGVDEIEFAKLRDLDIEAMSREIELRALKPLPGTASSPGAGQRKAIKDQVSLQVQQSSSDLMSSFELMLKQAASTTETWTYGRFRVMQNATRCAVLATGQRAFPMMLVNFDFLLGDSVTDRKIPAMPWILADIVWVHSEADLSGTVNLVCQFLSPQQTS